ncbi:MAG: T9SS type A sorting domain-containing protein, partial [Candidatus Eisenbacteria bacterium]
VFGFAPEAVDPDADPAHLKVRRWDGSAWAAESSATALPGRTQAVGLRSFGEFVLGNPPRPVEPPAPVLAFAISSITPNPVRDLAVVTFDLPTAAPVRLRLFDLQGRLVSTLLDAPVSAGRHSLEWHPSSLDGHRHAGLLFLRLEAPGVSRQRRVVLTP